MKFRVKMTLYMVGLLSLLFGIGGSILISSSFRGSLEREKEMAWQTYQMTLSTLQIVNELEQPLDYSGMSRTLEQLADQNSASWAGVRLEADAQILYEAGNAAQIIGKGVPRPEAGNCLFRQSEDAAGRHWLVLSGTMQGNGDPLCLHTVTEISSLYEQRYAQQRTFAWVFLGMALLCAALSYTISRMLTAPLEGLSRTTRAIASGRFSSRVCIRSSDEVGQVSADFNAMAERLERMIQELQDAMERQENFMGSFAHELKTPMTSVIGYAELLLSETLTAEEQTEAARYIFSEGKRLESLSRKLLDLLVMKSSALPLQPVSPAALLEAMVEELKPVYRAQNIRLACRGEEGLCLLEPDLVRSLLLNLLDNARKAMEQGGAILLFSEMTEDGCRIGVRDNGQGIPAEALSHLTEAFYRVDKSRSREQGGVGLGLTLCREIVALHKGTLQVKSRPGQGSWVVVELRGGRP